MYWGTHGEGRRPALFNRHELGPQGQSIFGFDAAEGTMLVGGLLLVMVVAAVLL